MSEETTTEQLAEIEGQAESTPATEYTPPEGWRVLAVGELLQPGDHWVNWEGTVSRPDIQHGDGATVSGGRYIRWVKPQPQPEPEKLPEGCRNDGGWSSGVSGTEPEPWPEPQPPVPQRESDAELQIRLLREANDSQVETIGRLQAAINERAELGGADQTRIELQGRIRELETIRDTQAATIEELRSEVSHVQNLLGTERRRVTELEKLTSSLRTINVGQEKAFEAAGKENTALRNQLAAVKAELASVAADRQQLRVELDAAQQVPADSPELRQLRADLEQMTQDRDTYRHAHELLLNDVNATHQRTKVMTIEAIVEWLVPIRTCGSQALATAVISNLPHIMRSLTGLEDEDIE